MPLSAHSRLLPLNKDGPFDAFKIAHRHVGVRVLLLQILPRLNRKLHGFDHRSLACLRRLLPSVRRCSSSSSEKPRALHRLVSPASVVVEKGEFASRVDSTAYCHRDANALCTSRCRNCIVPLMQRRR
jgi:hypothetical protein